MVIVYGYGNVSKANSTKVNGNTIFDIASITKTFTTTLLADMVKQGLVNLDDPIGKYLPATVKVPTYNGHKITLEDQLRIHQDYRIFLLDGLETIPILLSRSIVFFQKLHS